ncbi:MAG: hypothetical protein ACYTBS_00085 [Planctomycetota bacterium]
MHFNVTYNPTAKWAAQQITETFPYDTMPKYVIRDRDRIYSDVFSRGYKTMQIEEVLIVPKSLWQNPLAERGIGSIRRESLDHFIILNEKHFLKTIAKYVEMIYLPILSSQCHESAKNMWC